MKRGLIEVIDHRVARAIAHPLRRELLRLLSEREASPSELAAEVGKPIPTVSYHVRKLANLGLVELVRTTPRRGATEHHYRAVGTTFFPGEVLAALPTSMRETLVTSWWRELASDVVNGLGSGGWDRADAQALRAVMTLDEQGWQELGQAIEALYRRALEIEAESTARRGEQTPGLTAVLALLLFEHRVGAQSGS
jgi:DNA-binding transcriptional ArsR family regulator